MRSARKAGNRLGYMGGAILAVAAFALLLWGAFAAINAWERTSAGEQTDVLLRALKQAAVTCYAVEGRYPDSAAELTERYGITYDEERYVIAYDAFASNILPDIRVIERGERLP